jgi:hypothetical protein
LPQASNIISIKHDTIAAITGKFNRGQLEQLLRDENITGSIEALTESEGRAILRFGTLDALRNRILEARWQAGSASNGKGVRTPHSLRSAVLGGLQSGHQAEIPHMAGT